MTRRNKKYMSSQEAVPNGTGTAIGWERKAPEEGAGMKTMKKARKRKIQSPLDWQQAGPSGWRLAASPGLDYCPARIHCK